MKKFITYDGQEEVINLDKVEAFMKITFVDCWAIRFRMAGYCFTDWVFDHESERDLVFDEILQKRSVELEGGTV